MNEPDATNQPLPNGDTPETAPPPAAADGRPRGKRRRRRSGDRSFLSRSQARELALQALFEIDVTDHDADEVLGRIATDDSLPAPVADYALTLARGVAAHQAEIDPRIAEAAPAFPLPQVANVDRNVLRLAIYELLHQPDVPLKAAINEAVELAKRFGGESSGRFVNGVLGTVAARLDGAGAAPVDGRPTPG